MVTLAYTQRTETHVHQNCSKGFPRLIKAREENVLVTALMPRALAIDSPASALVGLPIQPDGDRVSQALEAEARGT